MTTCAVFPHACPPSEWVGDGRHCLQAGAAGEKRVCVCATTTASSRSLLRLLAGPRPPDADDDGSGDDDATAAAASAAHVGRAAGGGSPSVSNAQPPRVFHYDPSARGPLSLFASPYADTPPVGAVLPGEHRSGSRVLGRRRDGYCRVSCRVSCVSW